MNAQTLYMRYGCDLLGEPAKKLVIGRQGVTAAENHLINVSVTAYIRKCLQPLLFTLAIFLIGKMTTKAVTAVNCAGGADDEQQTIAVFMYNASNRVMARFI